jgi:hypothetical protein
LDEHVELSEAGTPWVGSAKRAWIDVALDCDQKSGRQVRRFSIPQKTALAQGFNRGIKLLPLGFDDLAKLSLK